MAIELGLTAARKLGYRHAEETLLGNLGNTYRDLGQNFVTGQY